MAVPTITLIDPATGSAAGGNLIKIEGTNFNVYTPPAYGYQDTDDTVLVKVEFGGVASSEVYCYTSTTIWVEVPPYVPENFRDETFDPVDIRLVNLDEDLAEIAGEEVTVSQAYTYTRELLRDPRLSVSSPFVRMSEFLIKDMGRSILLNTGMRTHVDYSPDGVELLASDAPTLRLFGPDIERDPYGLNNVAYEEVKDGTAYVWPAPEYHTLGYEVLVSSDNHRELMTLQAEIYKYFRQNTTLSLPADVPENTEIVLQTKMVDQPSIGVVIANSSIKSFSAAFEIWHFPVLYLPPYYISKPVDDVDLQTQQITSTLVETVSW